MTVTVGSAILVVDAKDSGSLSLSGNAIITETGPVVVDSSSSTALQASGNAQLTATVIDVVGAAKAKSGNAVFHPTPVTGSAAIADPLAGLGAPAAGTSEGAVNLSGNSSLTINPGLFSQIAVSGNAHLTLSPGIYEIAGGGFNVSGNAIVSGSGVLIYNAGSAFPKTGGTFGAINLSGNSTVTLTALKTGIDAGISIFQSRDNTTGLQVSGNAMLGTTTLYAPSAALVLSGNSNLSGALIVDQLSLSGNADPSPVLPQRKIGPSGENNGSEPIPALIATSSAALDPFAAGTAFLNERSNFGPSPSGATLTPPSISGAPLISSATGTDVTTSVDLWSDVLWSRSSNAAFGSSLMPKTKTALTPNLQTLDNETPGALQSPVDHAAAVDAIMADLRC